LKIKVRNKTLNIVLTIIAFLLSIYFVKNKTIVEVFGVKRILPIYYVDTSDKRIALTFDVSWGKDNTDKILNILDKYNVKASFFVIGGWADENPDKVKEIYKRGHEIGNHSNKHPDMTRISKSRMIEEIDITDAKIRSITGQGTVLFRCPEGMYNDSVVETVLSTGHYCIQWDVDSIDWMEQGADTEYKRVISKVKPGSILLFHNNAAYTPQNLPRIIEKLKSEGYEFVKAGDLIYKDKYHIDYDGRQVMD
jgi:peptidoglycan-N-acetylglucosamine deacetylase